MSKFFIGISMLMLTISCNERRRDKNSILLKQVRMSLYATDIEKGDSIMGLVDSIGMNNIGLGYYYLTKGFLLHKNGQAKKSANYIEKASNIISLHDGEEEKAELNLIWGLIFEDLNLPSKAAESYFEGVNNFRDNTPTKINFYLLLGLVRTAADKDYFLNLAENILPTLDSRNDSSIFYKAKAYITLDIEARHILYLKALHDFGDLLDTRGRINLYGTLALNCQILVKNDSANYYLEKAKKIISENDLLPSQYIKYSFVEAYIDMKSGRLIEAGNTIDSTIALAQNRPGLLSQAYLRKSNIESMQKNYSQSIKSLLSHNKYEKKNLKSIQANQIALMTIHYKLDQQQFELLKVRNYWLKIVIGLMLGILTIGVVFFINKRRNYKEKQALKDLISLNIAEKYEMEKKYRITKERLIEQTGENVEKLKNRLLKQKKLKGDNYIDNPLLKWEDFRISFIYNNPLYFDKLLKAHKELTAINLKYCACIYARLSNQQIAFLLEVSQSAVNKAKKKLRLIFQIETVQALPNYLQSIDQRTIDFS